MDVLNPYDSPRVVDAPGGGWRSYAGWKFWVWLCLYGYPVWAAVGFYQAWFVASALLGRFPRAMLDDPKNFGGLMDVSYLFSVISVLSVPLFAPVGLAAAFFCPIPFEERTSKGAFFVVVYVMVCIAIWMILGADPGGVVYWWLD